MTINEQERCKIEKEARKKDSKADPADAASQQESVGGINFDPRAIELKFQKEDQANLAQRFDNESISSVLPNYTGFIPVIVGMKFNANVKGFLGVAE